MNTTNKALIGLLIVQFVLLGMTLVPGGQSLTVSEAVELFPGLEAEKVTSVKIWGPARDGEGQETVELLRKGDGWVIGDADDFPAKKDEVQRLISSLIGLKSRNKVLTASTYHEKLEVASDTYRRKVVLGSGSDSHTVFLGSSPSFKNIHVRLDGDDNVYQVSDISESDAGARAWSWVDRTYVKFDKKDVWSVTIENEHGKIQLDRDPNGDTWAVLGVKKEIDSSKVEGLVSDARDIGLEAPIGKTAKPEFKVGEVATITLVTGTSTTAGLPPPSTQTTTIQLGAKIEDKDRRYAKASTSDYVVEVAGWEVNKLVEAKRDDLLKKEEEDKSEDK